MREVTGSNGFLKHLGKVMDQLGFTCMQHELAASSLASSGQSGNSNISVSSKATKKALKNADHLLK